MSVMETVGNIIGGLRKKPTPPAAEIPRHMRRVKTPAEYEEEDRAKMTSAALRQSPQQSGQKLVPDSVMNYGD
jgi:hypothetical protein